MEQQKKLHVVFVTMDEPFYIPVYIDKTLRKLPNTVHVTKVIGLHPHFANKSYIQTALDYLSYFGIILFAYMILLKVLYRASDIVNGLFNRDVQFHSVELVCKKHGVPFSSVYKINAPESLSSLKDLNPDIIFSISSPQIFKKDLIALPQQGCLNIHSSLLPAYRGQNANFWVLAKGEKTTGVTIHYINPGIDDGDIVLQEIIDIDDAWSVHDLYMKAIEVGAGMIAGTLLAFSQGNVKTQKNDISKGSLFPFPKRDDVKELRSRNRRFFKFY